jgi:glucose 1-dehydrogenase
MTMERTDSPRTGKRLAGEPWEIARLALYLASDEADHVTGQSFTLMAVLS